MSHADDIHKFEKFLRHLLYLKRKQHHTIGPIDPDLDKKIKLVRHLLKKLKKAETDEKNVMSAELRIKALEVEYEHHRQLELAEKQKKKQKEEMKLEAICDHLPKPYVIVLKPRVKIDLIEEEYKLFIHELLLKKNHQGLPLYHETDFVFIPVSAYHPHPTFRLPNPEVTIIFTERLFSKNMVSVSSDLIDIKQFLETIRSKCKQDRDNQVIDLEMDVFRSR